MHVVLLRSELKSCVSAIERAVADHPTLPILKNALFEANDGNIRLSATNLELASRSSMSGQVLHPGATTIPLRLFLDMISNIPAERLELELKNDDLSITTDTYEGTIRCASKEEFPIIPSIGKDAREIKLSGVVIREALLQVLPAAQANDLRPELSAILFESSVDSLKLVGTDIFRLAERTIHSIETASDAFRKLVPLKAAQEIARSVSDAQVSLSFDNTQVYITDGKFECISRLVEGLFPEYGHIIPSGFQSEIICDRNELMQGIRLVGVMGQRTGEILINKGVGGKGVDICAKDAVSGEGVWHLSATVKGELKEVRFNARYLLDGLKSFSGKDVFLGLNEDRPAIIKEPKQAELMYLIAPLLTA